jgi:hypothetical protein
VSIDSDSFDEAAVETRILSVAKKRDNDIDYEKATIDLKVTIVNPIDM